MTQKANKTDPKQPITSLNSLKPVKATQNKPKRAKTSQNDPEEDLNWPKITHNKPQRPKRTEKET